jgi:hypothetical protein
MYFVASLGPRQRKRKRIAFMRLCAVRYAITGSQQRDMRSVAMKINTGKFSKFLVAVLGMASAGLSTYYHGSPNNTWVPLVVEGLTALGVYLVPNVEGDNELVSASRSPKV